MTMMSLAGDAVELNGFLLLEIIPHHDAVGRDLNEAFIGEVVPARHQQAGGHAERARRPYPFELLGLEIHHRRKDQCVRPRRLELVDDFLIGGKPPIEESDECRTSPHARKSAQQRGKAGSLPTVQRAARRAPSAPGILIFGRR